MPENNTLVQRMEQSRSYAPKLWLTVPMPNKALVDCCNELIAMSKGSGLNTEDSTTVTIAAMAVWEAIVQRGIKLPEIKRDD